MRSLTLAVIVGALALTTQAQAAPNESSAAQPVDAKGRNSEISLHVEGSRLLTPDKREVILRGINLGGWLVTENWMCGFTDINDTKETSGTTGLAGRSALASLEGRFGPERAARLMAAWQDNWITASDLDQIRSHGFNLIRVPISFRTLQHADGSWILDASGQVDFGRMDWVVREAAQRGIYTIFDLHVWPQQRSDQDKIGRSDGLDIRESMTRLWTVIAAHYRGNGAIAAFDLLNEFPGNWGVQQIFSRAVRDADRDRIQVVGGFTFAEFIKLQTAGEFPNSIFSDHFYGDKPLTTAEFKSRLQELTNSPVPVYIGEFLAEDFAAVTIAMDLAKISWSPWTYKAVDMGNWAIFNYYSDLKTNIQDEAYDSIEAKWSSELTQWQMPGAIQNYYLNMGRSPARSPDGSEISPESSPQSNL